MKAPVPQWVLLMMEPFVSEVLTLKLWWTLLSQKLTQQLNGGHKMASPSLLTKLLLSSFQGNNKFHNEVLPRIKKTNN